MDVSKWKEHLEKDREEKDWFFANHWQSPVLLQDRAKFKGLDYFPPDPNYRFELELHEHREKKTVKMAYSKGEEREFIRWGEFRFRIEGKECTLQAYKSDPREERLFIPFKDATSGKETYGAGRYLDLEPGRNRTPSGRWILDFNRAYNPWCAYNEMYTCPFILPENWLDVPIRAGEKKYPLKNDEGK